MFVQTVNSKPVTKPKNKVHSALRVGEEEIMDGPVKDLDEPLPLRALLTRPVVVSVANYGMIALLDMIAGTLISFIWSTSVEFGGLSMSPASIGLWTAGYGLMNCVFQFVAFPCMVRRFGPRLVFIASILCFSPIYIMFPLENLALRHFSGSLNATAGLLMVLQLSAASFSAMGSGKFPSTLKCARSLKWYESIRCDIHVHIYRCPEQAVSRRHEWACTDNSLDSTHGGTSRCCIVVRILIGKQHLERKFCVCSFTRRCVYWIGRRCPASKEHVET